MHDIPILHKTSDFYRELYVVTGKMPKRDRYALGERLHTTALAFIEHLTFASYLGREKKLGPLYQATIKLDLMRQFLKLGEEIQAIPTKQYLRLEERVNEIGKMLGGWMRSLK